MTINRGLGKVTVLEHYVGLYLQVKNLDTKELNGTSSPLSPLT